MTTPKELAERLRTLARALKDDGYPNRAELVTEAAKYLTSPPDGEMVERVVATITDNWGLSRQRFVVAGTGVLKDEDGHDKPLAASAPIAREPTDMTTPKELAERLP